MKKKPKNITKKTTLHAQQDQVNKWLKDIKQQQNYLEFSSPRFVMFLIILCRKDVCELHVKLQMYLISLQVQF